ncbi:MAG: type 4a pilus biogenesis protein PilO [Planctomycetes bacterium]|nr:type 4a pilus biogenesis protein PilO [Planctomycetota bacterium]
MQIQRHALLLILGYVGALAASGGAGYYFYDEFKTARDEEANVRKQIELADIKIRRVPALETDVICLRENLSELVKILPNRKEVNEFVNKIADFAAESGVHIYSLKDEKDRSKKKDVFDKVIYKLSMDANLGQFLDFLSLCEGWERFARVTMVEITAGEWKEGASREEVVHKISTEIETYAYRGNDDTTSAIKILNYDKRREALQDEIVSRRADIQVERYAFVPNPLRRDPFIDPRRRLSDEGEGGLPLPEQKAIVEGMVERAARLQQLARDVSSPETNFIRRLELETEIDRESLELKADLDQVLAVHSVTDLALRRRIEREVMPSLKELLDRDQSASAAATVQDLRRFAEDMATLLDEGKYELVLDKHGIIAGRIDAGSLTAEGAALLHVIETAADHAKKALEFGAKEIRIGGVIVGETGSVVIVNGSVLQEGDALEDGVLVHRIAPDRVDFEYRGVVLSRSR